MKSFLLPLAFITILGSCSLLPGPRPGPGSRPVPGDLPAPGIPAGPRMTWTVQGGPAGQGSLFVQGTLHLGRDELYPLDERVLEAMAGSEVILAELSPGDLAWSRELVLDRMAEAVLEAGKTLYDLLPAADVAIAEEVMGKENFRRLAIFRPWVAYSAFELFVAGKLALDPEKGVDTALYSLAASMGKTVQGLEDPEFQLDVLVGPSLDIQVSLLRDAIREHRDHPDSLKRIYEAYREGDHRTLAGEMAKSIERSLAFAPELAAFNDSLLAKRNAEWARILDSYLRQGKTVFVFAGAAHMLGAGNVLERLAGMGYTVKP
ncbi:MAG: TraB/GumN family protein [Spirochaetia bacterium]|nr:TraB/GumN family protein [Spirochaetia bacterium]